METLILIVVVLGVIAWLFGGRKGGRHRGGRPRCRCRL